MLSPGGLFLPLSFMLVQLKIVFHFQSCQPFKGNLRRFEAIAAGSGNLTCINVTPL